MSILYRYEDEPIITGKFTGRFPPPRQYLHEGLTSYVKVEDALISGYISGFSVLLAGNVTVRDYTVVEGFFVTVEDVTVEPNAELVLRGGFVSLHPGAGEAVVSGRVAIEADRPCRNAHFSYIPDPYMFLWRTDEGIYDVGQRQLYPFDHLHWLRAFYPGFEFAINALEAKA